MFKDTTQIHVQAHIRGGVHVKAHTRTVKIAPSLYPVTGGASKETEGINYSGYRKEPSITAMPPAPMKKCTRCKLMKLEKEDFGSDAYRSDGIASTCKVCAREHTAKHRAKKRQAQEGEVDYNWIDKHHHIGGLCYLCEEPMLPDQELEYDHVQPLSRGGKHRHTNIIVSHKTCNRHKLDKFWQDKEGNSLDPEQMTDEQIELWDKMLIAIEWLEDMYAEYDGDRDFR